MSKYLTHNFDGATIFNAMGIYRHENGEVVTENTLRIEILEFDGNIMSKIKEAVNTLKQLFNQESIAVQIEKVNSELW